jgi:hypothetical protein
MLRFDCHKAKKADIYPCILSVFHCNQQQDMTGIILVVKVEIFIDSK